MSKIIDAVDFRTAVLVELSDDDGQSRAPADDKNNVSVQEAAKCVRAAVEEFGGETEKAGQRGSLYAFESPPTRSGAPWPSRNASRI